MQDEDRVSHLIQDLGLRFSSKPAHGGDRGVLARKSLLMVE